MHKGTITQFDGSFPVAKASDSDALSPPLVNRCIGYDSEGLLQIIQLHVGDVVAYEVFQDGTGVAIAKL